jgi:hypothetical protein
MIKKEIILKFMAIIACIISSGISKVEACKGDASNCKMSNGTMTDLSPTSADACGYDKADDYSFCNDIKKNK